MPLRKRGEVFTLGIVPFSTIVTLLDFVIFTLLGMIMAAATVEVAEDDGECKCSVLYYSLLLCVKP